MVASSEGSVGPCSPPHTGGTHEANQASGASTLDVDLTQAASRLYGDSLYTSTPGLSYAAAPLQASAPAGYGAFPRPQFLPQASLPMNGVNSHQFSGRGSYPILNGFPMSSWAKPATAPPAPVETMNQMQVLIDPKVEPIRTSSYYPPTSTAAAASMTVASMLQQMPDRAPFPDNIPPVGPYSCFGAAVPYAPGPAHWNPAGQFPTQLPPQLPPQLPSLQYPLPAPQPLLPMSLPALHPHLPQPSQCLQPPQQQPHKHPQHQPLQSVSSGGGSASPAMLGLGVGRPVSSLQSVFEGGFAEDTSSDNGSELGSLVSHPYGQKTARDYRKQERNAREQRRAMQITEQTLVLQEIMESSGVPCKSSKHSILSNVADYIRDLQRRTLRLERERRRWVEKTPMAVATEGEVKPDLPNVNFHQVFDYASVALAVASVDGRFVDCNQRFEKASGYSREELKALTLFNLTAPSELQQTFSELGAMMVDTANKPQPIVRKAILLDGGNKWSMIMNLARNEEGQPEVIHVALIPTENTPPDAKPAITCAQMPVKVVA